MHDAPAKQLHDRRIYFWMLRGVVASRPATVMDGFCLFPKFLQAQDILDRVLLARFVSDVIAVVTLLEVEEEFPGIVPGHAEGIRDIRQAAFSKQAVEFPVIRSPHASGEIE